MHVKWMSINFAGIQLVGWLVIFGVSVARYYENIGISDKNDWGVTNIQLYSTVMKKIDTEFGKTFMTVKHEGQTMHEHSLIDAKLQLGCFGDFTPAHIDWPNDWKEKTFRNGDLWIDFFVKLTTNQYNVAAHSNSVCSCIDELYFSSLRTMNLTTSTLNDDTTTEWDGSAIRDPMKQIHDKMFGDPVAYNTLNKFVFKTRTDPSASSQNMERHHYNGVGFANIIIDDTDLQTMQDYCPEQECALLKAKYIDGEEETNRDCHNVVLDSAESETECRRMRNSDIINTCVNHAIPVFRVKHEGHANPEFFIFVGQLMFVWHGIFTIYRSWMLNTFGAVATTVNDGTTEGHTHPRRILVFFVGFCWTSVTIFNTVIFANEGRNIHDDDDNLNPAWGLYSILWICHTLLLVGYAWFSGIWKLVKELLCYNQTSPSLTSSWMGWWQLPWISCITNLSVFSKVGLAEENRQEDKKTSSSLVGYTILDDQIREWELYEIIASQIFVDVPLICGFVFLGYGVLLQTGVQDQHSHFITIGILLVVGFVSHIFHIMKHLNFRIGAHLDDALRKEVQMGEFNAPNNVHAPNAADASRNEVQIGYARKCKWQDALPKEVQMGDFDTPDVVHAPNAAIVQPMGNNTMLQAAESVDTVLNASRILRLLISIFVVWGGLVLYIHTRESVAMSSHVVEHGGVQLLYFCVAVVVVNVGFDIIWQLTGGGFHIVNEEGANMRHAFLLVYLVIFNWNFFSYSYNMRNHANAFFAL